MLTMTPRLKPIVEILNRCSGWLLLLAIGWLCWTAARLLWLLVAAPMAPTLPLMPLQNNQATTDYSGLYAIFADPAPATAAVQPPPNVLLKGVLLAVPDRLSSALLDVNGEVKNYRIGDSLQNSGYTLVAVDWNAVVIADANEQQTVIRMADAIALDQRGQAAGAIGNQRLPDGSQNMATPMQNIPMQEGKVDNNAGATTDNSNPESPIAEAVTALQENPASYLSRMGVMASGEGYQVTAAMPAGVRSRLGLEPGDKVLSVNGQSVGNNPTQDAGLLQQVQQSGQAKIEVKRGDKVITVNQQF
ncbi:PDZ domain-containing protein [Psychrobacter sp. 16-MNA-CIBAN-0192]|uniref:PDZ domain-containing protein n=1 Tax=Psychrobacter sp. 16-MNA-CIBAN-0192 TaxID=3140448 RepID=UPI0033336B93